MGGLSEILGKDAWRMPSREQDKNTQSCDFQITFWKVGTPPALEGCNLKWKACHVIEPTRYPDRLPLVLPSCIEHRNCPLCNVNPGRTEYKNEPRKCLTRLGRLVTHCNQQTTVRGEAGNTSEASAGPRTIGLEPRQLLKCLVCLSQWGGTMTRWPAGNTSTLGSEATPQAPPNAPSQPRHQPFCHRVGVAQRTPKEARFLHSQEDKDALERKKATFTTPTWYAEALPHTQ